MTKLTETLPIETDANNNNNNNSKKAKVESAANEVLSNGQIDLLIDEKNVQNGQVPLWSPTKTNITQATKLVEFRHLIASKYNTKLGNLEN
jgi:hypothetical protein